MHGPGTVVERQGILPIELRFEDASFYGQAVSHHRALIAGGDLQVVGVDQLSVGVQGQAALGCVIAVVGDLGEGRHLFVAGGRP